MIRRPFIFLFFIASFALSLSCRTRTGGDTVTIALPEKFSSLDTLTSKASDAAADRVRDLMFNSLVKKDENFDYVGSLAQEIKFSDDGKTITFVLHDNVKFQNGKTLTSADVKYTFDELFKSDSNKSHAFFETVGGKQVPHITSIEAADAKTINFVLSRSELKNQLLPNLVTIPIIPEGTISQQNTQPLGTGAFKFVSFDPQQNIVELEAFSDYWEGAPKVQKIRVKTITDAGSLQAELQSGGTDIAPLPNNLSPDTLNSLGQNPRLQVKQFDGSNIDYLGFNTQAPPLDNVKIRQAIAYAVDREKIIKELLAGQAVLAHSVLPEASWAYSAGTKYEYNPDKAKQLVQESGYKNEPIKFKFSQGNNAVQQYAQVIQNELQAVGLNVEIETMESGVLRSQLTTGQFQMNTGRYIGGNQDPIFLRDLFSTQKIPTAQTGGFNRSRYGSAELDKILEEAFNTTNDRAKAKDLYIKVQETVSRDVPLFPLWYPANMCVFNRRIGNVKIGASGDFTFVKDITLEGK